MREGKKEVNGIEKTILLSFTHTHAHTHMSKIKVVVEHAGEERILYRTFIVENFLLPNLFYHLNLAFIVLSCIYSLYNIMNYMLMLRHEHSLLLRL